MIRNLYEITTKKTRVVLLASGLLLAPIYTFGQENSPSTGTESIKDGFVDLISALLPILAFFGLAIIVVNAIQWLWYALKKHRNNTEHSQTNKEVKKPGLKPLWWGIGLFVLAQLIAIMLR